MSSEARESFEGAFEALFLRAVRVAFRILGQEAAAEDVAAEALARAHLRWGRLAGRPYRDAWVFRVTTNLAIDAARRRPPAVDVEPASTPEDVVVLRVALVQALARLPRRQKEAITLRYLCGLSEAETASAMRIAVGTVKASVHKGLGALRSSLAGDIQGLGDEHS